jgi:diaminopimelate epimerase
MQFVKSHGIGNDYIVLEPDALPFELTPAAVELICNRNLGVGSDGILARAEPGGAAAFALTIYNPDGSQAEKSGNGIRIFAKYLFDHGRTNERVFAIETAGGDVEVALTIKGERVVSVSARMGRPIIDDNLQRLAVGDQMLDVVSVSVGNPHCVVLVDEPSEVDLATLGPAIEHHPAFPNRTNVQFAKVLGRERVAIRIWERGVGETMASGSSSCAVAAACHHLGLVDSDVTVQMDGGDLQISLGDDGVVTMDGPVEEVFCGDFSAELLARLGTLR